MVIGPWDHLNYWGFVAIFAVAAYNLAKTHWSIGLCCLVSMASAVCAAHGGIFSNTALEFLNYLRYLPSYSLAIVFMFAVAAKSINSRNFFELLGYVNLANSIYVIFEFLKTRNGFVSGGFLLNSSMNSSFIAATIPFAPVFAIPFYIAAVFLAKASVPIAVMGVVLASMFLKSRYAIMAFFMTSLVVALFAYFTPDLLDSSGRFLQWHASWNSWLTKVSHWFGCGAGTYYLIGSFISVERGMIRGEVFSFMHNDWLQILFECGALGLAAFCNMVGHAAWFAQRNMALLSSMLGFATFGIFNMPLRYVPVAFVCAIILKTAFETRSQPYAIT